MGRKPHQTPIRDGTSTCALGCSTQNPPPRFWSYRLGQCTQRALLPPSAMFVVRGTVFHAEQTRYTNCFSPASRCAFVRGKLVHRITGGWHIEERR